MGDMSSPVNGGHVLLRKILLSGDYAAMAGVDREKLRDAVADSGKSARAISLEANLGPTAIKDILSGKSRSPGAGTLAAIAERLGLALSDLMGGGDSEAPSSDPRMVATFLPTRFRVQAGYWLEEDAYAQSFNGPSQPVAPDPRFSEWPQWLEEVVGDSVDLKIPEGGFAHVVDACEMGYAPRAGDFVVVERRRDGGHIRERTIKQVVLNGRTVELWPRSSNPKWSEPISLSDGRDSTVEVEIVGLVIGAYHSF